MSDSDLPIVVSIIVLVLLRPKILVKIYNYWFVKIIFLIITLLVFLDKPYLGVILFLLFMSLYYNEEGFTNPSTNHHINKDNTSNHPTSNHPTSGLNTNHHTMLGVHGLLHNNHSSIGHPNPSDTSSNDKSTTKTAVGQQPTNPHPLSSLTSVQNIQNNTTGLNDKSKTT